MLLYFIGSMLPSTVILGILITFIFPFRNFKKILFVPRFESTGSGGVDGILCDSCIINVKKLLVFETKTSGNTEFANDAMVITYAGANTTLFYGSIHSAVTQVGTLVNYGTLLFGSSFGYGSSPWGNPPVTETGPFAEIKNYGT